MRFTLSDLCVFRKRQHAICSANVKIPIQPGARMDTFREGFVFFFGKDKGGRERERERNKRDIQRQKETGDREASDAMGPYL